MIPLFPVLQLNRLVNNATDRLDMELPRFTSGDNVPFEIQALNGTGTPWEVLSLGSYSAQIGIFSGAGVQLAYQNTFTADAVNNVYTGTLSLNDAALIAAVAALTPASQPDYIDAYFSIRILDGSGNPFTAIPVQQIKLGKGLFVAGAVTTPPGDTTATQEWATNTLVRLDGGSANRILKSPSGLKFMENIDDAGTIFYTPLQ